VGSSLETNHARLYSLEKTCNPRIPLAGKLKEKMVRVTHPVMWETKATA
jgi:hypothetical protein